MSIGQAVWIGLCQIFSAVFPGTSRSMSTITGGELAGMSRPAALEFSFFLSIPTMIVATVLRPVQVTAAASWTAERDRGDAQRRAFLDRAGDRVRDFVHRGVRRGGVVHEVGAHARVRRVCDLSDHCGRRRCCGGWREERRRQWPRGQCHAGTAQPVSNARDWRQPRHPASTLKQPTHSNSANERSSTSPGMYTDAPLSRTVYSRPAALHPTQLQSSSPHPILSCLIIARPGFLTMPTLPNKNSQELHVLSQLTLNPAAAEPAVAVCCRPDE